MFCEFKTTTHGKWILAGEHAVLRDKGALVFPIKQKKFTLDYRPSVSALSADCDGSSGMEMRLLFWSVLERGQKLLGNTLNQLTGHFQIQSHVPIGVGMGASAALCVAVARWFAAQQLIKPEETAPFARSLENLFHGQSSGLDIAGVATESGIYFQNGQSTPITPSWQPCWYLSSCGQIGITSHCIDQVSNLWRFNEKEALAIDESMNEAVDKAKTALEIKNNNSLDLLVEAIQQSADCFNRWDLVSENLSQHMQMLQDHGALAVKPTGSGGGGYVLSLWHSPPNKIPFELIAV